MNVVMRCFLVFNLFLFIILAAAGCKQANTGYVALILPADGTYTGQTLELMQKDLETWEAVSAVTLEGLPRPELQIEFDREKIWALGLEYEDVVKQTQAQLKQNAAKIQRSVDLNRIRIKTEQGFFVTLGQIAVVTMRAGDNRIFYQGKQVYKLIVKYEVDKYAMLLTELASFKNKTGMDFRVEMLRDMDLYLFLLSSERQQDADRAAAWLLRHPAESHEKLLAIVQKHEYTPAASRAVRLLGRMGVPADVEVLRNLVSGGPRRLLTDAAAALALHRSPDAFAVLVRFSGGEDAEAAAACITALGRRGDQKARPHLEALLSSPLEIIRYKAVDALSLLGAGPSKKALQSLLAAEPSARVRKLIKHVLER